MAKIHKLSKNGQTIYPATTTDAVAHPSLKVSASKLIGEINVSNLYPTGGTDGTNKYTLASAIAKIPTDLRTVGIKCSFLGESGQLESWEFQGGTFTAAGSWIRMDGKKITGIDMQSKSVGLFSLTDIEKRKLPKLNIGELTNGRYKRDGSFVSDGTFRCTSKIDIVENATMLIALKGSNNAYADNQYSYAPILFFDSEDNLIDDGSNFPFFNSSCFNNSTYRDYIGVLSSFTTPANARKFILTGVILGAADTEYIKKSDIISVYLDERKNYPIVSIDGISNSPIEYSLGGKYIDANGAVQSNYLWQLYTKQH